MGWRDKGTVTVDFGNIGFEGWKAKVVKMNYLTLAETKILPALKETDTPTIDDAAKVLAAVVLEWNITGPDDDIVLPIPKDSNDWMNKAPIGIINEIVKAVSEGVVSSKESFR